MGESELPTEARPSPRNPRALAPLLPGTVLAGRYRVVALLGRGGRGEVYRADDLKLGDEVKLARLVAHPSFAGPGTGAHHQKLVADLGAIVETLLAEPTSAPPAAARP